METKVKAQHTPGPWVVTANTSVPNEYHLWNKDGNYFDDAYDEVMDANASLMAAAPELLEALEALAEDYGRLVDKYLNGRLGGSAYENAIIAIVKAKGGAA